MPEYFILANSFAAPFFSDDSTSYVDGNSPKEALEKFAAKYTHPCGLYAAAVYPSADAMHKGQAPLGRWYSNHQLAKMLVVNGRTCYSYRGDAPGRFSIDDEQVIVENPKGGMVVMNEEKWKDKTPPSMKRAIVCVG